ncbi:MAG: hypothetical protein ACKO3T_10350 [Planctomycetaceae bacterium]
MPANAAHKERLEALRLHFQTPDADRNSLMPPLCNRCTPVIQGLIDRLCDLGVLPHLQTDDDRLDEARSVAACVAAALLDGTCNCGDAADQARFHRRHSPCGPEHSLNGWDHQHESLNRFLLRSLLAHTAPPKKVLEKHIDTPQKLRFTAFRLSARNLRERTHGMALRLIQPQLKMLIVPVCERCQSPVSQHNSCQCVSSGCHQWPLVKNTKPRLITEDQDYLWLPAFAWRIIPANRPGDTCRHKANAARGGILFVSCLAPNNHTHPQPASKNDDHTTDDEKTGKQPRLRPPCPLCGIPLSGKPTKISVRCTHSSRPNPASNISLPITDQPDCPAGPEHHTHTAIDPDDVMYDAPTTLSTTDICSACPAHTIELTKHLLKRPPEFTSKTSQKIKNEWQQLQTDLQLLLDRLNPDHPKALDEQTVAGMIGDKLDSSSPELRQCFQKNSGGS